MKSFFAFLLLVFAPAAWAEGSADANGDRAQQQRQGALDADQGNKDQLQPSMMMHNMQAMQHLQKADQARQQKDYGTADKEEQMAMMEQMKTQQLQQQINANNQSAQQNTAGADKISADTDPTGQQAKGNSVIDLRVSDTPSKYARDPASTDGASTDMQAANGEIVSLGDVVKPLKTTSMDSGGSAPQDQGKLGSTEQLSLGFDDSTKGGGKTPEANTTSSTNGSPAPTSGSMMMMGGGSMGGSGGGGGGSAGGGSGDFWGSFGQMVEAANQESTDKDTKLSLKKFRGGSKDKLPGAELNDEQFWKKVGKEPAECKLTDDSTAAKRKHQNCLHVARKGFEDKWREGHKRSTASSGAPASEVKIPLRKDASL